jgi:hypothetical protein
VGCILLGQTTIMKCVIFLLPDIVTLLPPDYFPPD